MQRQFYFTLIFLILSFASTHGHAVGYEFCELKAAKVCTDNAPRLIDGIRHAPACWKYETVYTCYGKPETTCPPQDAALERDSVIEIFDRSKANHMIHWVETKKNTNSCRDKIDTQFGCSEWYSIDDGDPSTIDPDAITCRTEEKVTCQPADCRIITQKCTNFEKGICNQEVVRYSCSDSTTCGGEQGLKVKGDSGSSFGEAITTNALLDVIGSSGSVDSSGTIRLFQGEHQTCKYMAKEFAKATGVAAVAGTILSYVFGGPLGLASAPLSAYALAINDRKMECCQDNPKKVDPQGSFGYCTDDEKQLAIARKTKRAIQVGGRRKESCFCTDKTGLGIYVPLRRGAHELDKIVHDCSELCQNPAETFYPGASISALSPPLGLGEEEPVEWQKDYCVFDDILSKIIQTQGRDQINEILDGPTTTNKIELSTTHNYYGYPGWSGSVDIGGNLVSFWTWDSKCNESDDATRGGNDSALFGDTVCPNGHEVYAAICSKKNPSECGQFPASPLKFNTNWDVRRLEINKPERNQDLNQYAAIKGQCFNNHSCSWDITGWPAGVGAQLMQKAELVWQPKFPYPDVSGDYSFEVFKGGLATLDVQMLTAVKQSARPARPTIRVRPVGASNWQTFQLPSNTTDPNFHVTLNSGEKLFVSGSCSELFCKYAIGRKVTLTRKVWYRDIDGGRETYCLIRNPLTGKCMDKKRKHRVDDREAFCQGFSLDEFLVLDISKMDLSEYTEALTDRANSSILKWIDSNAP